MSHDQIILLAMQIQNCCSVEVQAQFRQILARYTDETYWYSLPENRRVSVVQTLTLMVAKRTL